MQNRAQDSHAFVFVFVLHREKERQASHGQQHLHCTSTLILSRLNHEPKLVDVTMSAIGRSVKIELK